MANSNTYMDGYTGGSAQLTTLSNIQGNGLTLPIPTNQFIDIRSPGKLERLFLHNGNANSLYTTNKPTDSYLKGPLSTGTVFQSINDGQKNKLSSQFEASRRDGARITRFLKSSAGTKFILKQLVLQGFQPFDETKVYNPASPIISALRLASFGLVDRPTRHIDTSNIVGGLLGGTGLGSITRTVGGLFGGGPGVPSPPRSSVASGASSGFGLATFTSLLGGADKADKVVSPLARPDVRDLLRGQTATNAYNAPRYNKLVGAGGGSFFGRLLSGAGKFLQNNTLIGGIIPPKQPWAANYRADEQTYDLYLNAGKLFNPDQTGIGGGGILGGILKAVGFGKKANYSQAVRQRFYNESKNSPNFNRTIVVSRTNRYTSTTESTNEVAYKTTDQNSQITTRTVRGQEDRLKYTDLINVTDNGDLEQSDQLLNYKVLTEDSKKFSDAFSDKDEGYVKDITDSLNKAITNIVGVNGSTKYEITNDKKLSSAYVQQFGKMANQSVKINNGIGFDYLTNLKKTNVPAEDITYERRWSYDESYDESQFNRTRIGRSIRPTNDVDYVNSLEVLGKDDFEKKYANTDRFGKYGPDIINFYFYDIVNEKYIPFNAIIKNISDNNTANWESVEYLGRPDKLWYYKNFERQVSFNFKVVAHSIKELMPMWNRINYLVGLTRPANYTLQNLGGFMISPMVQLTLGDFYKNHNIAITSCNVNIPEDASWETLPESLSVDGVNWFYGPNKVFEWSNDKTLITPANFGEKNTANSKGRYAQFPREADISIAMNVLEKDRPKTGRSIWGDAPVKSVSIGVDSYEDVLNGSNSFSTRLRYDTDLAAANEK